MTRAAGFGFGLVFLAMLTAACGGDDSGDPALAATAGTATQSAAVPASASPSASMTATSSSSPGATGTATPGPGAPTPPVSTGTASAAATTATTTAAATVAPLPAAAGAIASISLASAGISASSPIEVGDTVIQNGLEYFEDPGAPANIIWYPRFGVPGNAAGNTIMAGHVNYVGYGDGPFANLLDAAIDDALYVTNSGGGTLTYTVKSVTLYRLAEIDMNAVVFPPLDSHTERITLISCGGTFIPAASGYGGEYDSRIVLVAERTVG